VGALGRTGKSLARVAIRLLGLLGGLRCLERLADRLEPLPRRNRSVPMLPVRRRRRAGLQILMYHRVGKRDDAFLPVTELEVFRRQMACLADCRRIYPLDEAVEALAEGRLEDGAVAVTFDDGYRDNYLHAFPVLRDHGLCATIFLATGYVGTGRILWHDRVFRAFHSARRERLEGFGPGGETLVWHNERQKREACLLALRTIRGLTTEARDHRMAVLEERLDATPEGPDDRLMLDWPEVREMHAHGIRFGSHTVNHPILAKIPLAQARRELTESRSAIRSELGGDVSSFAYPNGQPGDFNETTRCLLRETGYRCAVTTVLGVNAPGEGNADPYALRREAPWERDVAMFRFRLAVHRFRG